MWGLKRWQDWGCRGAATMLIRPWVYSHTQNGVFRGRLKHTHARTPRTHLHNHSFKHLSSNTRTPTHTCIHQAQNSTQYLGGYSREGGALRDVFGYLQSLYPQGGKHQLLLGRTQGGFGGGGGGGKGRGIAAQGWESKRKTYIHLSWAGTYLLSIISHSINLFHTVS